MPLKTIRSKSDLAINGAPPAFAKLPIGLPAPPTPDTKHAYHLFTVMVAKDRRGISRDAVLDAMNAHRIGTGVHYPSVPERTYYTRNVSAGDAHTGPMRCAWVDAPSACRCRPS